MRATRQFVEGPRVLPGMDERDPTTTRYFFEHVGESAGPFTLAQLRPHVATGDLQPTTRMLIEDTYEWAPAETLVPSLFTKVRPRSGTRSRQSLYVGLGLEIGRAHV